MTALHETLITEQLWRRPPRVADYAAENRGLRALAGELANPTGNVLNRLCELALELCGAHSAGISLVEFEGVEQVFRWHAIAGKWAKFAGGGLPRNASPCGIVVDLKATQLMARPGRVFPLVDQAEPEVVEVLLAPFHLLGECVGTVWVVAHDDARRFDREDARVVESLASVAAVAFTMRDVLTRSVELSEELKRSNARLMRMVERQNAAQRE